MEIAWRAPFTSAEVNALHAECFETRVHSDEEWDWARLREQHSLGWVSARESGALVGFANLLWDGLTHAWIQDVMVSPALRHAGIGTHLVATVRDHAREAGCEWLHVDFEEYLTPFYLGACGFTATRAGVIRL
jgi:GNAT superfamily N-acetyltransferase